MEVELRDVVRPHRTAMAHRSYINRGIFSRAFDLTGPEEFDRTMHPRRKFPLFWLGIGFLLATFLVSIPFLRRDESTASTDARPIAVLPEGFASSNSCKECHPHEHRSWHASYHRTMTQLVSSDTAPSAIHDVSVIIEGEQYRFEQEGEQFFVTFHDPVANGETRRREIVMMTGSHHMHAFWYDSGVKRTPGLLQLFISRMRHAGFPDTRHSCDRRICPT